MSFVHCERGCHRSQDFRESGSTIDSLNYPFSSAYVWQRRYSSVGIATRYGLDGPGIEPLWVRDVQQPFRPALGPTHLIYNGHRVIPSSTADEAWRWPPTLSSAEVKVRVDLFHYSPSGPSWRLLGWNFALLLPLHLCLTTVGITGIFWKTYYSFKNFFNIYCFTICNNNNNNNNKLTR
jgi:hypothetical protein